MQLLPSTWRYVETVLLGHTVPHDADGNVEAGVALLHHLLGAFGGNERLALAAWYQGERSVRRIGAKDEPHVRRRRGGTEDPDVIRDACV